MSQDGDPRRNGIFIRITKHYRPDVQFSLVTAGGHYEVLRLYVDVREIHECMLVPPMAEGLLFRTNYNITLTPSIRIYPLLPPRVNASDTWVLKGKDAELFGVSFDWPRMAAFDIAIKATVFDYEMGSRLTIASKVVRLERQIERVPDGSRGIRPGNAQIPFSPYLYKLMTIDGFAHSPGVANATELNVAVREEITRLNVGDHPWFRSDLLAVDESLRVHLDSAQSHKASVILFLAADPTNASRLRLGQEVRDIQEKLQLAKMREKFILHQRMSVRPTDVTQALLDLRPTIVHFAGHGTAAGQLCLEDSTGRVHAVDPAAITELFEQFKDQVKCVVLNACYSEEQAGAIAEHIDHVIGMHGAIGDEAALAFAAGFYQALGGGCTIEEAYKLGRVQIRLQGIPEHLIPILRSKEPHSPFVFGPYQPERLVAFLKSPGYQRDVSVTYSELADLAADAERPERAEQLHRQALAIREKLTAAHPENSGYQQDLAITYERLGSITQLTGTTGEAADWFTRALELRRLLYHRDPSRMDFAEELGRTLRLYAWVLDDDSDLRREAYLALAVFARDDRLSANGEAIFAWAQETRSSLSTLSI